MSVLYRGFLVLGCLILEGCSLPRTSPAACSFAGQTESAAVDPSFQTGLGILSGFDPPQADAAWAPDDWVLLGIKVTRAGQKEDDVWFVRLSTLPPHPAPDGVPEPPRTREFAVPLGIGAVRTGAKFTAPIGRVRVETYDRDGMLLRTSTRIVPQVLAATSLLDALATGSAATVACRDDSSAHSRSSAPPPPISKNQSRAAENMTAQLAMLEIMGGARSLYPLHGPIRQSVIKKPTILDLLLNGLRLNLQADVEDTQVVESPWSAEAALTPRQEGKFPVCLAGHRLFDCRIIAGPADPPYNLTGGVLLFEAVHPENPQNRLTIRVLAAKRMGAAMTKPSLSTAMSNIHADNTK